MVWFAYSEHVGRFVYPEHEVWSAYPEHVVLYCVANYNYNPGCWPATPTIIVIPVWGRIQRIVSIRWPSPNSNNCHNNKDN